ncbi:hypothetical protein [Nostoc sp.]|uniref:hypothetical protein n=1 Tax=Nostoc sp. TaxID=1180 RepID=UPI002FEF21E0
MIAIASNHRVIWETRYPTSLKSRESEYIRKCDRSEFLVYSKRAIAQNHPIIESAMLRAEQKIT